MANFSPSSQMDGLPSSITSPAAHITLTCFRCAGGGEGISHTTEFSVSDSFPPPSTCPVPLLAPDCQALLRLAAVFSRLHDAGGKSSPNHRHN